MLVSEIYASLQGEGLLAGTPSTFVRTSGCHLRCRWCDTPFTSWRPEGTEMPLESILTRVERLGRRHVVLTGGEPLLHDEMPTLCETLRGRGHHVTIETAGSVASAAVADLLSASPKLSASGPTPVDDAAWHSRHERLRRCDDSLVGLLGRQPWQIKFVVDSEADVGEALGWLEGLEKRTPIDPARVFLMPQGFESGGLAEKGRWLERTCAAHGIQFAPRHHIAWFGHARGT
jgi:7-carboxy-7-deazaguanine synthase